MNWKTQMLMGLILLGSTGWGFAQDNKDDNPAQNEPVAVGEQAPDFELKTFDEKTVKLSDRFSDDGKPVVLLFSRAHW